MRVLVACEFSGVVRDAFLRMGHDAWSCDLIHSTSEHRNYIRGDVLDVLCDGWDLMIAHPPCTYLTVTANSWAATDPSRAEKREQALEFICRLLTAPIPKICLENPVGVISSYIRRPDQIIQPFWFGDRARKKTCLWLKGLPRLRPTQMVEPSLKVSAGKTYSSDHDQRRRAILLDHRYKYLSRGRYRSITYPGIAEAMAGQWGQPSLFGDE